MKKKDLYSLILHPDYRFLETFVRSIPERFENEGETIYTGRNLIKVFDVEGLKINVKRYKVPIYINRVVYTFLRKSKAYRAYSYADRLKHLGVDTPAPIASLCFNKRGLLHRCFFVSVQLEHTNTLYEAYKLPEDKRKALFTDLGRYTAQLHGKGIYHKDYSPGNILYDEKNHFYLVDINRMQFDSSISLKKGCKNFARLWGKANEILPPIAEGYARERGFDYEKCLRSMEKEHESFWKSYERKKKRPAPFISQ